MVSCILDGCVCMPATKASVNNITLFIREVSQLMQDIITYPIKQDTNRENDLLTAITEINEKDILMTNQCYRSCTSSINCLL